MSGGGTPANQTVTNQTVLPGFIQNQASMNLDTANAIAERPYDAYQGQQIAGLTPDQQAAYGYIRDNMATGANAINAANAGITGSNLTTTAQSLLNPYLDQVETNAVGQVNRQGQLAQNNLAAQAASAGAFGGTRFGVQAGVLGAETARQAGDLSATIRSQGWDKAVSTALTQAQTVAGLAGQSQQAGLTGANALAAVGGQEQNQAQAQLSNLMQQWQDARDYPLEQLAIKQAALTSTPYGGTSVSSQPIRRANPAMGAAGGALSGAAAGSAILPGYGTAAGAVIGGIAGYLGSR